jgi:hypothetical protein
MGFDLGSMFEGISSSYGGVGEFFSEGLGLLGDAVGGGKKGKEGGALKGAMAPDYGDDTPFDLSAGETARLFEKLNSSSTAQRRNNRQGKLDNRPSSASYQDNEAMWMRRLSSIAQGNISIMESK